MSWRGFLSAQLFSNASAACNLPRSLLEILNSCYLHCKRFVFRLMSSSKCEVDYHVISNGKEEDWYICKYMYLGPIFTYTFDLMFINSNQFEFDLLFFSKASSSYFCILETSMPCCSLAGSLWTAATPIQHVAQGQWWSWFSLAAVNHWISLNYIEVRSRHLRMVKYYLWIYIYIHIQIACT